jgi:hypothetical protein
MPHPCVTQRTTRVNIGYRQQVRRQREASIQLIADELPNDYKRSIAGKPKPPHTTLWTKTANNSFPEA